MTIEANSFKGWGYPFIAQDYEAKFNTKCPNATLYGIIVEPGDELKDIMGAIHWCIQEKYPAIMIELCNIENTYLESDIVTFAVADLEAAGYKDLQSYEHRLAFGKLFE